MSSGSTVEDLNRLVHSYVRILNPEQNIGRDEIVRVTHTTEIFRGDQ